jgi:hypothetical protein
VNALTAAVLVLDEIDRQRIEDGETLAIVILEPTFVYIEREAPGPENLDPDLPLFLRHQAT